MLGESLARTRAFSLRAPITNEEERSLFQRRLALTSIVFFGLAGGFWLVTLLSLAFVAPEHVVHMFAARSSQLHLGTTSIGLLFWLLTRGRPRSSRELDAIDAVSAVLPCFGWELLIAYEPVAYRPDLVGLLACIHTLILRAALVPSTPARTALLGAVGLAPLVVITAVRTAGLPRSGPLGPAVYTAIWTLISVSAATTTTWVIYGLRMQVRKAMQLGQYLLEDKIGEGGMGAVYRASHALLRRPTAVKLLSDATEHAVERFEREVQITARLTHPNTIAIYDYGRTPDGGFYYAMEYLDGVSLEDLVDTSGAQPPPRVVHILLQVCGALREAHAAGLVHRDIKPANVMLTNRGAVPDFVKVLDFGLVKETVAPANPAVTHANAVLGTPHYMAPESILEPQSVDGRADIYALGATAFFLLTGERVFDGNNLVEVCSKHLHEPPPAPSSRRPGIPESLDVVVLACLAKRPEDRPRDAVALAALLRDADVPAWTEADALAWWSKHEKPSRQRAVAVPSGVLGETLAVVVDGRLPEQRAG